MTRKKSPSAASVSKSRKRALFYKEGLAADVVCAWLLSIGVLLAVKQLFRFDNPVPMVLFRASVTLALVTLATRRWWALLASTGGGLLLAVLYAELSGQGKGSRRFVWGLIRWWVDMFPSSSVYNTEANIELVHWIITVGVVACAFFLVRRLPSFFMISGLLIWLFISIITNKFRDNLTALCLITAGVLPLLARAQDGGLRRRVRWNFAGRRHTLMASVVLCASAALLAGAVVPKDAAGWRNPRLSAAYQRLKDSRSPLATRELSMPVMGLQPNPSRLGGDIEMDHRLVMRVKTNVPVSLRGRVYDVYTGQGWENTRLPEKVYSGDTDEFQRAFDRDLPVTEEARALLASCTVTAKTEVSLVYGGTTLFSSGRVTGMSIPKRSQPLRFNAAGELFVKKRLKVRSSYHFTSLVLQRDNSLLPAMQRIQSSLVLGGASDGTDMSACLQLPSDLPRSVKQTADRILSESNAYGACDFQKALVLESFLKENGTYTLTPGSVPQDRDFVAYFLESGVGYCVYFASAMAVMARTQGIPSRYVIGYGLVREGENWAAYTDTAHAWVECYFEGVGWLSFDPTPGSAYERPAVPSGPAGIQDEQEEESTEATTTTTTAAAADDSTTSSATRPADKPPLSVSPWLWGAIAGGLLLTAAIGWLLLRVLRRMSAFDEETVARRFADDAERLEYYYTDVLRQLALLGFPAGRGETALRHLQRVLRGSPRRPLRRGIRGRPVKDEPVEAREKLAAGFLAVMNWRYGGVSPGAEEVRQLAGAHEALEKQLRRRLGRIRYVWHRLLRK